MSTILSADLACEYSGKKLRVSCAESVFNNLPSACSRSLSLSLSCSPDSDLWTISQSPACEAVCAYARSLRSECAQPSA